MTGRAGGVEVEMVLHPQDIRPGDYLSVGHHYWSKVTSCGYSEGARQAYVKCADVTYTFVIDGFERVTVRRDQGRAGAEPINDLAARMEDEAEDARMERKERFRRWVLRTFRVQVKR